MKVDFSKPLLIMSAAFKEVFLHMDGKGITTSNGSGAGTVNCQKSLLPAGMFKAHKEENGTFTLESVAYPGVFLRMDGNNVHSFAGAGAGRVNCQYGAAEWEHFKLNEQKDGSFTIESAAFPNVFLRMDGNNPNNKENDFGTVNCQYGAGDYEHFHLVNAPDTGDIKKLFQNISL